MKATSPKELAHQLKEMRLSQGLSQSQVAEKIGIRQDTVSAFENRPESTKMDTLFKILMALNAELNLSPRGLKDSGWTEEW